jgi:hypothetical protein
MTEPDDGPRDGETFDAALDGVRLNRQQSDVWAVVRFGKWITLAELSRLTGHPEASVSARLRDFRKEKFGSFEVDRRRFDDSGLWQYRLVPPPPPEPVQQELSLDAQHLDRQPGA